MYHASLSKNACVDRYWQRPNIISCSARSMGMGSLYICAAGHQQYAYHVTSLAALYCTSHDAFIHKPLIGAVSIMISEYWYAHGNSQCIATSINNYYLVYFSIESINNIELNCAGRCYTRIIHYYMYSCCTCRVYTAFR